MYTFRKDNVLFQSHTFLRLLGSPQILLYSDNLSNYYWILFLIKRQPSN